MEFKAEDSLLQFQVGSLPTIFYIPDFVTAAEEEHLLYRINSAPISKWKSLKNRRLQNWGGVVHEKGLISQPLPAWLSSVTEKICESIGLFPSPINHVLINEYAPGQGIMPHQDGPAYFPVVAIISLGSPAVMKFTPHLKLNEPQVEVMHENDKRSSTCVALMPRSLLIFKDAAYEDYLHGIDECMVHEFDEVVNMDAVCKDAPKDSHVKSIKDGLEKKVLPRTGTCISLTCRLVPKVNRNLIKL